VRSILSIGRNAQPKVVVCVAIDDERPTVARHAPRLRNLSLSPAYRKARLQRNGKREAETVNEIALINNDN